jgi:hypothetical protein
MIRQTRFITIMSIMSLFFFLLASCVEGRPGKRTAEPTPVEGVWVLSNETSTEQRLYLSSGIFLFSNWSPEDSFQVSGTYTEGDHVLFLEPNAAWRADTQISDRGEMWGLINRCIAQSPVPGELAENEIIGVLYQRDGDGLLLYFIEPANGKRWRFESYIRPRGGG